MNLVASFKLRVSSFKNVMRGKQAPKRKIAPDPKYHNALVAKFINTIMRRGKKATAQKVVYRAFERVQEKTKNDPVTAFDTAIKNIAPVVEVKSRRIGGSNYQVPIPVRVERRQALAFRWIIGAAKSGKGRPMHEKLADEIIAAAKNEGAAVKKREDVHRMAEANRAFAHFAR